MINSKNKNTWSLFDKIKSDGETGEYEMTLWLKQYTDNYDLELLKALSRDIDFYLFVNVESKGSEYSTNEVDEAIKKRLENGLEVPYKIVRIKTNSGINKDTKYVDIEDLLFNFEFYKIRSFKYMINKKIKEIENKSSLGSNEFATATNDTKFIKWQGTETELNSFIRRTVHLWRSLKIQEDIKTLEIENKSISIEKSSYAPTQWHGTPTEFIELVKALIESNILKGKQKDIITNLSSVFGLKINNPDKLIQDIKNRNTGSETLFLDTLKTTLYDYFTKENRR